EPATDGARISFGHDVEEVAELGYDLYEVAVHRENVTAGGRGIPLPQRAPHAVWWRPVDQPDARLSLSHLPRNLRRPVRIVVGHNDALVKVRSVHTHERFHKWRHIHLFVVARRDDGDGTAQFLVLSQIHEPTLTTGRLPRPDVEGPAELTDKWSVLQNET